MKLREFLWLVANLAYIGISAFGTLVSFLWELTDFLDVPSLSL
jgi:hypothetical protein